MASWASRRMQSALAITKGAILLSFLPLAVQFSAAASPTYIWPDCDTTHPCVVHHIDSVADGTAFGETLQDFKFPMAPSSPGNLLVFTVMHVSSKSITVTDNNNGSWQTAVTTTNAADGEESELLYICGATAGTNLITIHLSQPAVHDEPLHFTYDEVSGVAPAACLDATAAANGLKGTVQPGPVTTTTDGDMIFNYGEETYQYPEYDPPMGPATPDSNGALLMENTVDRYANEVSIQPTHGAYTPAITVSDPNGRNWNAVAAAFKPSAGAGTQPTGIHVTRILHYVGILANTVSVPFPSSGNAIVISTSNPSVGGWDMSNLTDNAGHTWTRTPFSNPGLDPQIFSTCLGTGSGGQNLVISWTPSSINNHVLFYDIAGAATTGGSTGCVGATVNTDIGYQPSSINASITGDPVFTPSATGSVAIATSYFGIGPPSASLTPGVVFNSIWATGMIDASSWDTGDPYGYAYTTSTSPISFNWQMANSTGLSNGGTNFDGAAIEILPGSTVSAAPTTTALTASAAQITAGSPVTLTATVAAAGAPVSGGSVSFYNGATLLGTATLTNGTATLTTSALPTGADVVSATYGGTTGFAASTSSAVTITVGAVGTTATTTALTASATQITAGSPVTLTATVSAAGAPVTGGSVSFYNGATLLGTATLTNGAAGLTTSVLPTGADLVSATYSGTTVFAASTSAAITIIVSAVGTTATTTALTASATQITAGSPVTLTATVAAAGTTVTGGSVSFYNGATLLGNATLTNGTAGLTTSALPTGANLISATYSGTTVFAASTSSAVTITVTGTSNSAPLITGMSPLLTLAGNPAFTLTVNGSGFTSASTVAWGNSTLTTQMVSANQLTAQVPATAVAAAGITNVTVQTPAPGGGTSNTFQFEIDSAGPGVTPPAFTPSAATVAAGSTATYTVVLPTGATNVSTICLNLPSGATCSYAATTGIVTLATAPSTPSGTYRITVVFTETLPVTASAFAVLPLLLLPFRRRKRRAGLRTVGVAAGVALLFIAAFLTSGCGTTIGGTTTTPTQPQTNQVTSSAVVTLTVQ